LLAVGVLSAAGTAAQAWSGTAGRFYLALAWATLPLLAATPAFTPRGRVALLAFAIMLLCATGSTIWN
jgi:hypothetical protein